MRGYHPPELVIDGPYGTGKTRGILECLHRILLENSGARVLLLRKTLTSLTTSALVTYRKQVLRPGEAAFFGGSKDRPAAYQYASGSELVVGGMDKPDKVLSTEYDIIYVPEVTDLTEDEWEILGGRLRNGGLPFQMEVGDCNPQGPMHWVKRRALSGRLEMLSTRHRDNPAYHDGTTWTAQGAAYMARLEGSLTGVRRLRGLEGRWVAAEGMIYEGWDAETHLINRSQIPGLVDGEFPGVWPRDWSVDFGYTNPFVWQQWVEDPDGRLYLEKEIYRTQRLVEDHARQILAVAGGVRPRAIYCDHDAEDRATLERHLGLRTLPAYKAVSPGIQAVATRLRVAGDGRPRLYVLRDALVERDPALDEAKKPASTVEEIDGYVWDTSQGQKKGEQPVKRDDHGMDAMRYRVASTDARRSAPSRVYGGNAGAVRPVDRRPVGARR